MIKYGTKIWTTNKEWFKEALDIIKSGKIDFLELYIVPNSFRLEELEVLKESVLSIHSPHLSHDFNISQLDEAKVELFKNQVITTADFLNSKFIILHGGTSELRETFKENIVKIYDQRILIENLPKTNLKGETCFGYSLDQLEFIKKECRLDICLDFTHSIKSAFSQGLNYKEYIRKIVENLKPFYFHIGGAHTDKEEDEHLDLWEGNFDLKWIKNLLFSLSKDKDLYLVFETPKKQGLKNDIKNINYFKGI